MDDSAGAKLQHDLDRQKAAREKEQGNQYFRSGRYKEALEHYTNGIQCDPSEPTSFCNRAMTYLKLKQYAMAKDDCDSAIALNSSYVKAYYRRGLACIGMNDIDAARVNFQKVIELEPSNRQAKDELKKLESDEVEDPLVVWAVKNPPDEWRKQPMSRITNIEEVYHSSPNALPVTNGTETVPAMANGQLQQGAEIRLEMFDLPPVPSTSVEFFTRWRSMASNDKDMFGKYFMAIPPELYPALFDRLIDSDLLADIIAAFRAVVLDNGHDAEKLIAVSKRLLQLSRLERFQVAFAFLDESQRQGVHEIMSKLGCLENTPEGDSCDVKCLLACLKSNISM